MSNFGPGEYMTRGGCKAVVEFVMPQPHEDYDLQGRILCKNGYWDSCAWTLSGRYLQSPKHGGWDLVQPSRDELKETLEQLAKAHDMVGEVLDRLIKSAASSGE